MAFDFLQLGYVTTDFARAIAELRTIHGLGPFKELRALDLPTGSGSSGVSDYALAFKAGLQFEVIRPVSGDVSLYRALLPDSGYALRLHHLGRFFVSSAAFEAERQAAAVRWRPLIGADVFGGAYRYFDSLSEIGHYSEIFFFPGDDHLIDVPSY